MWIYVIISAKLNSITLDRSFIDSGRRSFNPNQSVESRRSAAKRTFANSSRLRSSAIIFGSSLGWWPFIGANWSQKRNDNFISNLWCSPFTDPWSSHMSSRQKTHASLVNYSLVLELEINSDNPVHPATRHGSPSMLGDRGQTAPSSSWGTRARPTAVIWWSESVK